VQGCLRTTGVSGAGLLPPTPLLPLRRADTWLCLAALQCLLISPCSHPLLKALKGAPPVPRTFAHHDWGPLWHSEKQQEAALACLR